MRKFVFPILVFALAFIAGCGDSPKEKAKGVWKIEGGQLSGVPTFIEITDKLLVENGNADQAIEIAIDEKDGRAVIRKAGTDTVLLLLSFGDDKTVTAESDFFGKQKLTPSSKDELQRILFPSPERLVGFWSRPVSQNGLDYHEVLEIGKDFVRVDGHEEKIEITSARGVYNFSGSQLLRRSGRLQDDDTLVFSSVMGGSVTLKRTTKADAEKYAQAKENLPDLVAGLWMQESRRGKFDAPEFMEITRDAVVRNKGGREERQAGRLALVDGEFAMLDAEGGVLFKIERENADTISLSTGGYSFSRNPSWIRTTPEKRAEALAGYQDLPKQVLGIWRKKDWRSSVEKHPFLEITPQAFRMHGKDEAVTEMRGEGDAVVVKTDGGSYRVGIPDEYSVNLESGDWSTSGAYQRSSAEERDTFLAEQAALPDKVVGYWRGIQGGQHKNYHGLAITRDSLAWGGNTYPVKIQAKSENSFELINPETGGKYVTVTLEKSGLLFFEPEKYDQRGRYDRSTAEEYDKLVKGEVPLPAVYAGHWVYEEQDGINMKYATLFLGEGQIVRNGLAEPMRLTVEGYSTRVNRADVANYEIARLDLEYDKRDEMRVSFLNGNNRYRRATPEAYEKALAACRVNADVLYGEWLSEPIDRKEHPQGAIAFVKGGEGQWPVALHCIGLSVKRGEPERGTIPGIFDITGRGQLYLRGGKELRSRLAEITIVNDNLIEVKEYQFLHRNLKFTRRVQ